MSHYVYVMILFRCYQWDFQSGPRGSRSVSRRQITNTLLKFCYSNLGSTKLYYYLQVGTLIPAVRLNGWLLRTQPHLQHAQWRNCTFVKDTFKKTCRLHSYICQDSTIKRNMNKLRDSFKFYRLKRWTIEKTVTVTNGLIGNDIKKVYFFGIAHTGRELARPVSHRSCQDKNEWMNTCRHRCYACAYAPARTYNFIIPFKKILATPSNLNFIVQRIQFNVV